MCSSPFVIQLKINNLPSLPSSNFFATKRVIMAVPEMANIAMDPILFYRESSEAPYFCALAELLNSVIENVVNSLGRIFDKRLFQKSTRIFRIHRGNVHGNVFGYRLKLRIFSDEVSFR